jgi:Zn-dependent membrane protease YugP
MIPASKIISYYLKNIPNDNHLTGFEIAREIANEDVYIIEKKHTILNYYDNNRKTIKLSTYIYHGDNVVSSIIASKIAYQSKNKVGLGNILYVLDKLIILAYILVVLGIILFNQNLIYISISIILLTYIFTYIDVVNTRDSNAKSFKYLCKKGILSKEKEDISNIYNYQYLARPLIVPLDLIIRLISIIKAM